MGIPAKLPIVVHKYCKSTRSIFHFTELFYQTVHHVNAKDYTKEQLDVWATGKVNLKAWNQSFLEHETVVAVEQRGFHVVQQQSQK